MNKTLLFTLMLLCVSSFSKGESIGGATKYEIASGEELIELLNDSILNRNYFKGDSIILLSDIDLTKYSTIPKFNGYFDGKDHSVSNQKGPLFNTIEDCGIVTNVVWAESCFITGSNQGLVAQVCKGLISNCKNYGSFSQNSNNNIDVVVGGFCSHLDGGIISNSHNYYTCFTGTFVDKSLTITVGGICAEASNGAIIINCSNNAKLRHYPITKLIAGGIVGVASNTKIINCINNELVLSNIEEITSLTSTQVDVKIGGICGLARNCEVIHCLNDYLIQTNTGYCAGIVAIATDSDIKDCINKGKINNIDSYFYSNSAGIVCSVENSETKDFLNCVNFGEIVSYTKNAIATGAGLCSNLSNANIGMVANFGSVDVLARGTMASTIKYDNYNANNCNIVENTSDLTKWNKIISENYGLSLSAWDLSSPENPKLQPSLWFSARSFSNCGQTTIELFSADSKQQYSIDLVDSKGLTKNTRSGVENFVTFSNLDPREIYVARVKRIIQPNNDDNYIEVQIHLDKPSVNISLSDIGYESCNYNALCYAKGLCVETAEVSILNRYTNTQSTQALHSSGRFVDLFENTAYEIRPNISIDIDGNQTVISLESSEFATREYIPNLNIETYADRAIISCGNFLPLKDRFIGFSFMDSEYIYDNINEIELTNLTYETSYSIVPMVIRNNISSSYSSLDFATKLDGSFKPISISQTGAIIQATVNTGIVPTFKHNYDEFYVEYRNISDGYDVESNLSRSYLIDDRSLIACYIPFSSDDLIQYRTRSKYYKYESIFSWYTIDRNDAFDEVVIPHFFNCLSYQSGGKQYLACSPIRGDEEIIEWGIAYKYVKSLSFNETKLTLNSEGKILMETSNFVPNLEYIIKFYGKTADNSYFSPEYSYQNYILSPIDDTSVQGVDAIYTDTPSSEPLYYYNMMGIKSTKPFKGINIVVFDDGHIEKRIIKNI